MKSFTMFTTDVMGKMNPKRPYTTGRYEVIPAGVTRDRKEDHQTAVARFERVCQDALLEAKVDRAVELMARIAAARNRPIPDDPNAGPSPWELMAGQIFSAGELDAQREAVDQEQVCREAEAAYAARNPHKVGLYLNEDKVHKPLDSFTDAATVRKAGDAAPASTFAVRCRAAQAAYAARNPNKRGNV